MIEPIDFVILWVDGNDPAWQQQFNQYAPLEQKQPIDISSCRYRDWDTLRYWFRGVEQYAPWVRTIHLVTNGQCPAWLRTDHAKLHLVTHADYMAAPLLPTFNACPIENNMHRIEGLAEHFVFFNDDFFLVRPVSPTRFFRRGLPVDMAVSNTLQSDGLMGHITLHDVDIINHHFSKRRCLRSLRHWFSLRYGAYLMRTIVLLPWPRFSGFFDHHLPQPFLRSTFEQVWTAEKEVLEQTNRHRFRAISDVNQWLFRYWQLCAGTFSPMNVMRDAAVFHLTDANFDQAIQCLLHSRKRIIVINDGEVSEFENKKVRLREAFEHILPHPSSFER